VKSKKLAGFFEAGRNLRVKMANMHVHRSTAPSWSAVVVFHRQRIAISHRWPLQALKISRYTLSLSEYIYRKLLPVHGSRLGKWRSKTEANSLIYGPPVTTEKHRRRRQKTTSGFSPPYEKMADKA
jgi:hypothetical protein